MLTISYAPDGASSWSGGGVIVLVQTSRSLAELDVKFNHKRLIQTEQGFGAAAAAFFDKANAQNALSLKVRRGVDFTSAPFPDPEGALAFALQQPASFPSTGCLRIQMVGTTTNQTLYMLNASVGALSLADWLGNAPAFDYVFNGGIITATSPF